MNETISNHSDMVRYLAKDGQAILASLTINSIRLMNYSREIFKSSAKLLDEAELFGMSDSLGCHLNHMAIGVAGEAGELLDAVKKFVIYNKPLDLVNVIEELGDIDFYLVGYEQKDRVNYAIADLRDVLNRLLSHLNLTWEEIRNANMSKLAKRYPNYNYTDAAAHLRADKL